MPMVAVPMACSPSSTYPQTLVVNATQPVAEPQFPIPTRPSSRGDQSTGGLETRRIPCPSEQSEGSTSRANLQYNSRSSSAEPVPVPRDTRSISMESLESNESIASTRLYDVNENGYSVGEKKTSPQNLVSNIAANLPVFSFDSERQILENEALKNTGGTGSQESYKTLPQTEAAIACGGCVNEKFKLPSTITVPSSRSRDPRAQIVTIATLKLESETTYVVVPSLCTLGNIEVSIQQIRRDGRQQK